MPEESEKVLLGTDDIIKWSNIRVIKATKEEHGEIRGGKYMKK